MAYEILPNITYKTDTCLIVKASVGTYSRLDFILIKAQLIDFKGEMIFSARIGLVFGLFLLYPLYFKLLVRQSRTTQIVGIKRSDAFASLNAYRFCYTTAK